MSRRLMGFHLGCTGLILLTMLGCDEGTEPISSPTSQANNDTEAGLDTEPSVEDAGNQQGETQPRNWKDNWEPTYPVLRRLTKEQYGNVLRDAFGDKLVIPTSLEPDNRSHGLMAVGASINGLSPVGAEKYFSAAKAVSKQVVNQAELRSLHLTCAEGLDMADEDCLNAVLDTYGRKLWRRTLTQGERDELLSLAAEAQQALSTSLPGVETLLTGLLLSPHFLYIMTPTVEGEGGTRYSGEAMASRISFFLWNSAPDEELLSAAEEGLLDTAEGLEEQVARMITDPKTRRGMRAFFTDWWELDLVDDLLKDPKTFPHFYAKLGIDAREETLRFMEEIVFDNPIDIRELYTSTTTFVNPPLASIYQVPSPTLEGFGRVELDPNAERAGLLGQVSFLATQAHPTRPSPTLRGVFVREKLLCLSMPPPPANVDTTVPETSLDAPTIKEILEVHMKEPSCAVCHAMTDPIGLGFERFDGIGRYRLLENGTPIDPTGSLDKIDFVDARGLGRAVAEHPRSIPCVVSTAWIYANGRGLGPDDNHVIKDLEFRFEEGGYQLLSLLAEIAVHPAFLETREVQP